MPKFKPKGKDKKKEHDSLLERRITASGLDHVGYMTAVAVNMCRQGYRN